jgi:hypothetical protein
MELLSQHQVNNNNNNNIVKEISSIITTQQKQKRIEEALEKGGGWEAIAKFEHLIVADAVQGYHEWKKEIVKNDINKNNTNTERKLLLGPVTIAALKASKKRRTPNNSIVGHYSNGNAMNILLCNFPGSDQFQFHKKLVEFTDAEQRRLSGPLATSEEEVRKSYYLRSLTSLLTVGIGMHIGQDLAPSPDYCGITVDGPTITYAGITIEEKIIHAVYFSHTAIR